MISLTSSTFSLSKPVCSANSSNILYKNDNIDEYTDI